LPTLFRSVLPFWLLLLAGVLLITYLPAMTLALVDLLAR
jgi:TRAP-type C4-dicarboxylate transport system permease large subunit